MARVYEFRWKGRNRFGQRLRGKQLAETREQLVQRLSVQGIETTHLQRNFALPSKPKREAITQLLNQFSLLLNASMPLKQSLNILLENTTHIALYRWLKQLLTALENGFSLSQAFAQAGNHLNPQEIQLIQIGEKSGTLSLMLATIVENRFKSEKLAKKVKKILFYPLMILLISLVLSVLLLLFIVPKFAELYQTKEKHLPQLTYFLFELSDFLQHSFEILLLVMVIIGLILFFSRKQPLLSRLKWRVLNKLPLFGTILREARIILFCQNSGIMLKAHLRLDAVLHSFIQQGADPLLSDTIQIALERLKQGYRLNETLNPNLFPTEVLQMIAVGEKSGELAKMLLHISEMYQQKLDYKIDLLSQLLEPMLMLIIGVIVGTILIGLYLPIFEMGAMIE